MTEGVPRPRSLLPDTTVGQILTILLGGMVVTLAVMLYLVVLLRPEDRAVMRGPNTDAMQIASLIEALRAAPPAARPAMVAAIKTPRLAIVFSAAGHDDCQQGQPRGAEALWRNLARYPDTRDGLRVEGCKLAGNAERFEVHDGQTGITFVISAGGGLPTAMIVRNWLPLLGSFLLLFILLAVLCIWAVLRIIGPLQRLSSTVERFGREVAVDPLTEEGPREIRLAARAFNQMQERITGAVRDRTRTLAAISHDLRTPLTRIRLRTELERSGDYRQRTLRDLDLMQQMITSALDFLRGADRADPMDMVELGSLLESLCDEAGEAGADVQYLGDGAVQCRCRPNALGRAITNLIENACRYGKRARVAMRVEAQEVLIDVADDGPGIPAPRRAEAMQPFSRLNAARPMGDGVGLGLAIVSDIALLHGGRLRLLEAPGGGLLARIAIPFIGSLARSA